MLTSNIRTQAEHIPSTASQDVKRAAPGRKTQPNLSITIPKLPFSE